jgi:site-specific DNA-cytosine methylase
MVSGPFSIADILEHHQPTAFVLENVKHRALESFLQVVALFEQRDIQRGRARTSRWRL